MNIRTAHLEDAAQLVALYQPYVTDTTITFEYQVPSVADFGQRITTTLADYPYLVAEADDGTILGYAYAHRYKERPAYDWDVEVSVYVGQNTRGLGVGRQLYQALEAQLKRQHVVNLAACVTGKNDASIQFHEKLGYHVTGTFSHFGYKFGQWYDVIWLQKSLTDAQQPQSFVPFSKL